MKVDPDFRKKILEISREQLRELRKKHGIPYDEVRTGTAKVKTSNSDAAASGKGNETAVKK